MITRTVGGSQQKSAKAPEGAEGFAFRVEMGADTVSWSDLTYSEKLAFLDLWVIITLTATVLNEISSLTNLFNEIVSFPTQEAQKILIGLGCSLLWISVLRYLEYYAAYYALILTLRRGVPRVLRFLVGVLPVLMAYAFFGMAFFGELSTRFGSFGDSIVTLFAILNGDVSCLM